MNPVGLPQDGEWIYLIVNRMNDKVYVGKTRHPYFRCHQYIYDFRERAIGHLNEHMYNAMRKHGIKNFDFVLLENCVDAAHATDRELFWMDHFDSTNRTNGYNFRRDSREGMITHPETSMKIRANLLRQHASGLRSGHSNKLKANWANNPGRSVAQSALFKKYKTKWSYIVAVLNGEPMTVDYAKLRDLGLASVLSSFHRSKSNVAELKGFTIRRVPVCQN